MFHRCCLIHINIIILRRFIHLLYLCLCLQLGLFMPYLPEPILHYMINCIISWIQTCLFFCLFFRIDLVIVRWLRGWRMPIIFGCQKFSLKVLLSIGLIFCQFQPGLAYKSVALKKACSEAYYRRVSLMLRVSQIYP